MTHGCTMQDDTPSLDLTGKLLIAMPGMGDPRFAKSVIYMCVHSAEGAMGLVINQPAPEVTFSDLLRQLKIEPVGHPESVPVRIGGPVEHGRGFVLHSLDYQSEGSTLQVDQTFAMTGTLDVLEAIAKGHGPRQRLLALGYSGWGPGQLESEIAQNGWLTCDAESDLVFAPEDGAKWEKALATLGVDPLSLSATAGRA